MGAIHEIVFDCDKPSVLAKFLSNRLLRVLVLLPADLCVRYLNLQEYKTSCLNL